MQEVLKNKKKMEIIAENLLLLKDGEVITHKELSNLIQTPYDSQQYRSVLQQAKHYAAEHYGVELESIRGVGYRRIEPDKYVDHSLRHYKRGFKEFQKGENTLRHAPVDRMTVEGRDAYRRISDRAMILNASLSGSMVELKKLGEKRHPFLPENIKR